MNLLILALCSPGLLELLATLRGFNRKIWEQEVQLKLKAPQGTETNKPFKKSFIFGDFTRVPTEDADLFVTKPLFLALYHTLFGSGVLYLALSLSRERADGRFGAAMGLVGVLGLGLVAVLRRVGEDRCGLDSIYGNQRRKRGGKMTSRMHSYTSLSRQNSNDSLAQSMRGGRKRRPCEVCAGWTLVVCAGVTAVLASGLLF